MFSASRVSFALFVSVLVLDGCGGGSTPPAATTVTQQQQRFKIPQALHAAVPAAPPNVIPKPPTAAQRAAVASALRNFVPMKSRSVRSREAAAGSGTPNPIVRFDTSLGDIDVELYPNVAPKNVANFLSYVDSGAYNGSFVHRSIPSFAVQGGGYDFANGSFSAIPQQAAVPNEFDLSNVRGTLAMALSGPNTATDQWFFNVVDNSASLDTQNGGSTVIGSVVDTDGLAVMDAINALPVQDFSQGSAGSPFTSVPVVDYTAGSALQASNLVTVSSIAAQPSHPAFFDGEVGVGNGVDFLSFSNGNFFGYYAFLSDPKYIYHFDLGYEYVFDANDGQGGVYLYDFASDSYFYTSPSFPFPYLYDFSLDTVLYYYADPSTTDRYTSNPRYFYDFATNTIITK